MNQYYPYNILKYLRVSRELFSFRLINPQLSCFVRKVSVKCPETVVIILHIIDNTFVNIRINSHTMHFHHSNCFRLFAIAEFISIAHNWKKIFGQVKPGLNTLFINLIYLGGIGGATNSRNLALE